MSVNHYVRRVFRQEWRGLLAGQGAVRRAEYHRRVSASEAALLPEVYGLVQVEPPPTHGSGTT
jgi:hypothetical protein